MIYNPLGPLVAPSLPLGTLQPRVLNHVDPSVSVSNLYIVFLVSINKCADTMYPRVFVF